MTELERFSSKYMPEPNSGCWLWTGAVDSKGYGAFRVGGRVVQAHRVSMRLLGPGCPGELHALHRCDVRTCVNPGHLFAGTNAENVADKMAKGRHRATPR